MTATPSFAPGALLALAKSRASAARESGALHSIATRRRFIADGGMRFIVHIQASLETKKAERTRQRREQGRGPQSGAGTSANPFLPYDGRLFVADLSATHVCLLNKFNVVDGHLLLVTRAFEDQEASLTAADFAALALALGEVDGLGFFNGGTIAGASQPHKHLQLVPLPLVAEAPRLPVEPLLEGALGEPGEPRIAAGLPFRHALCRLERASADGLERGYRALLAATGLSGAGDAPAADTPLPGYNLLTTRSWMLLVPRTRERVEGISLNALAYAGSLFVRGEAGLALVERIGPMRMLRAAALPFSFSSQPSRC